MIFKQKNWPLLFSLVILMLSAAWVLTSTPVAAQEGGMDHSAFPQLQGPFEKPQDVTSACLQCHEGASQEVMGTIHWTWEYTDPNTGQQIGKNNVINNYCMAVPSNEPRCTSCHVGYGFSDISFFETATEVDVDCLVCHDNSGTYKKFPAGSGYPHLGDEPREFPGGSGKMWAPIDLPLVAQSVGLPSRVNCGSCHFLGGGGDAVEHGDLDTTLKQPDRELDVHMGTDGLDFSCTNCHARENHEIAGRIYSGEEPVLCEDCHQGENAPHQANEALVEHTDVIACQTCHIPAYARGKATMMTWDWSTAGGKNEDGKPFATKDEAGNPAYDSKKGTFTYEMNVIPVYKWWNGNTNYLTVNDVVDPDNVVTMTDFQGSMGDGKIYPFKMFTGIQPYDATNNTMVVPNLFPNGADDTDAYWKGWDWENAVASGMATVNADYSGELGWLDTEMFWVQNHMVTPKEQALTCTECHTDNGRLNFVALGYVEDRAQILTTFPPVEPTPEPTATAVPTDTPEPTSTPEPTEAPVEEPEEEETAPEPVLISEPEKSSNSGTVIVVVVAVLVLGAAAFVFLRRK